MNEEEIKEAGELENIVDIKYHLKQWKNESEKGELDECHLVEEDIEIMELAVNIIENQKAEIKRLKNIISNTSVQFINNTIKTDKKNKEDIEALNEGWKIELEKKDITIIETKEANRQLSIELQKKDKQIEHYQNMLATNDMLHVKECEKKDKIIDEMAKWLNEDDTSFGYGKLKDVNTPEKIKQYFERK